MLNALQNIYTFICHIPLYVFTRVWSINLGAICDESTAKNKNDEMFEKLKRIYEEIDAIDRKYDPPGDSTSGDSFIPDTSQFFTKQGAYIYIHIVIGRKEIIFYWF